MEVYQEFRQGRGVGDNGDRVRRGKEWSMTPRTVLTVSHTKISLVQ